MPKLPVETVATDAVSQIHVVRGQRVMLDSDLATLYGVTTKRFNEQIRRNLSRFPADFMFQADENEGEVLRSQFATSKIGPAGRGGRRYAPYVSTEHGAIMAATVLNSPRAVQMTVYVVRAFVKARQLTASHTYLAKELNTLKKSLAMLDADTRRQFEVVYEAILGLMGPKPGGGNSRQIGFTDMTNVEEEAGQYPPAPPTLLPTPAQQDSPL